MGLSARRDVAVTAHIRLDGWSVGGVPEGTGPKASLKSLGSGSVGCLWLWSVVLFLAAVVGSAKASCAAE